MGGGSEIVVYDTPLMTCNGTMDPNSMTTKMDCQFARTTSHCTIAFQRVSAANDDSSLDGVYNLLNCQCGSGLSCYNLFNKQYNLTVQSVYSDDVTFALTPLGAFPVGGGATGLYHPSTQSISLRSAPLTICAGRADETDNSAYLSCKYEGSGSCTVGVKCTDGPCAGKSYPALSGMYSRTACSCGSSCPLLFDTSYNTTQQEGSVTIAPVQAGYYLTNIGTITTTGNLQISSVDGSVKCTGTYSTTEPREVSFNCESCLVTFTCVSGDCMKA